MSQVSGAVTCHTDCHSTHLSIRFASLSSYLSPCHLPFSPRSQKYISFLLSAYVLIRLDGCCEIRRAVTGNTLLSWTWGGSRISGTQWRKLCRVLPIVLLYQGFTPSASFCSCLFVILPTLYIRVLLLVSSTLYSPDGESVAKQTIGKWEA